MGYFIEEGALEVRQDLQGADPIRRFFEILTRLPSELQHHLSAIQAGSQRTTSTSQWLRYGYASLVAREEFHHCKMLFSALCCRKSNLRDPSSLDFTIIDRLEAEGNLTPNEGVIARHLVRVDEGIRHTLDDWIPSRLPMLKVWIQHFRQENHD